MNHLKGKKLLVLGGTNNFEDITHFAKREGVKIVVAGSKFSTDVERMADEKCYTDVYQKEQIRKVAEDYAVDGIFCAGNETIISNVIDVAEEMGFPFYSNRSLWDTLMNKKTFKDACRQYGIPTPMDFCTEVNFEEAIGSLPYPVVVKPVDNSGANGVFRVDSAEEFAEKYNIAKSYSKNGDVTVEEYLDGDQVSIYYTFVDGHASMSCMHDKYIYGSGEDFNPMAEAFAYPSRHIYQYLSQIDKKMRKMLSDAGVKNGVVCLQCKYSKGQFKFFEMGYRLGGTSHYRYTDYLNGANSLEMLMEHSLSGKVEGYDQKRENPFFDRPCCTYTFLSRGGIVDRIEGIDVAKQIKGVLHIENRYKVGDRVSSKGTVGQIHIRTFLIADSVPEMKELISRLQSVIDVYDTSGQSMLIKDFDVNRLDFGNAKFARGGYRRVVFLPSLTGFESKSKRRMLRRAAA